MMKNNINSENLKASDPTSLISYLTEGSVLWVLVTGVIILIVAAEFFAPW